MSPSVPSPRGQRVPMRGRAPAMSAARRVLADVFGFEAFRPGQEAVIEALLGGRNVLAVMPTGSGTHAALGTAQGD